MGSTTDQRDAIVSIFRTVEPTIPAGALGVTEMIRPGDDLDDDQFPHLFIGEYLKNVAPLDHQQEETTANWSCLLYTATNQTDTLNLGDALEDAINGSSNLGGLVDKILVRLVQLDETVDTDIRMLGFVIETVREA